MAPVPLPGLQVKLQNGATTRILNGVGAQAVCDTIRHSSAIPGGYIAASFRIADSERSSNSVIYRYGTLCQIVIAPGYPDAGFEVWSGFLLTPSPAGDASCTVEAVGFYQLVQETETALLWMDAHIGGSWSSTDNDPFGPAFRNCDAIVEHVDKGSMGFNIAQGQAISGGDTSRLGWWFQDHAVTRVAGKLRKNNSAPNYTLRLRRYAGPNVGQNGGTNVDAYPLGSGNNVDNFDTAIGVPQSMVTLELSRSGGTGTTGTTNKIWFTDIRVNGDAYRAGITPGDTYVADGPIRDMAALLGFTTGKVTVCTQNVLPLWQQSGSWADMWSHLATILYGANGWKWAVWGMVGGGPEVEFRDYATGNTTWTLNGYTSAANTIQGLDTASQDVYNRVIVTYRFPHSPRLKRAIAYVVPNPFAGMTGPLALRQRAFTYALQDPQRLNSGGTSTLAENIAATLALSLGTEQWAGTIEGYYANDGTADRSLALSKAGQLVTVADQPGGSKTFRIQAVEGGDDILTKFTIGRLPDSIDRMIWLSHRRAKEKGTHHVAS
jgi:hypothetical protein